MGLLVGMGGYMVIDDKGVKEQLEVELEVVVTDFKIVVSCWRVREQGVCPWIWGGS